MRWMPMLFQFCREFPVKFLAGIWRKSPIAFDQLALSHGL
jgi:hypothetical protein